MAHEKGKRKAKNAKRTRKPASTSSRAFPSSCGYSLSATDTHEACPVCLGMLHAKTTLESPDSCPHCSQMIESVRKRRVDIVAKAMGGTVPTWDPDLTEPLTPTPELENIDLKDSGQVEWGDSMDMAAPVGDSTAEFDTQGLKNADNLLLTASGEISDEEADNEDEREDEEFPQNPTAALPETQTLPSPPCSTCVAERRTRCISPGQNPHLTNRLRGWRVPTSR